MAEIKLRDVDDELHRAFKTVCAREGITMREKIIQFLRAATREEGDRP